MYGCAIIELLVLAPIRQYVAIQNIYFFMLAINCVYILKYVAVIL